MSPAELGWSDSAAAIAGASAGLTGLIIVAMSVNIARIMQSASIPARAGSALGSLTATTVVSCLVLIPDQPLWLLGAEVAVLAVPQWALWGNAVRAVRRDAGSRRPMLERVAPPAIAPLSFTVGAILLMLGASGGIAWVAAASLLAIIAGVVFSWIALVEILR